MLIETKWKYTYALHVESNTIIHKADDAYDFFLYFKYDYAYREFLNNKLTGGNWSLNNRTLFYSFKHIQKFEIERISRKVMILEFNQPNAKGTYQYHFIAVSSDEAPFIKPPNELPDVIVEDLKTGKKKDSERWWVFGKQKPKKQKKNKKYKPAINDYEPYINIELIGGGYYGGIDPVLRDFIQIKNDGRLIKEYKSVHNGLITTKKNIPRAELEQFAEFIIGQQFFEMNRMYDCEANICQARKGDKPTPIPLRLAVTYGSRRKVVTISIWGKDKSNIRYVDYPAPLDEIITTIQKMADRYDEGMSMGF